MLVALSAKYEPTAHELYVRHLSRAVASDPDQGVRNIALTGAYGSGKSSVLEELTRTHSERIVMISLSSLGEEDAPSGSNPAEADPTRLQTNRIQKEVVKQLLYRADPLKVRNSQFRRLTRFNFWRQSRLSMFLAIIVMIVIYSGGYAHRFVDLFGGTRPLRALAYVLTYLFLAAVILGIQWILQGRLRIDKLSAGPATVTLSNSSSSYFDEYLDEIVYFFEATSYDTVVFEDIDRFDNQEIFETLRELNIVLNNSKQLDRKPIRFIYALRDSIFERLGAELSDEAAPVKDAATAALERSNRTKFFDLVIPIVPFITHRTAGDLMKNELGPESSISPEVFDTAAKYIVDMRMIKNIRNEFVIFKERLLAGDNILPGLSENSLFALLIYKNIHLTDFERIKSGKSKLDSIYQQARALIDSNIEHVNNRIMDANRNLAHGPDLSAFASQLGNRLEGHLHRLFQYAIPNSRHGQYTVSVDGMSSQSQFSGSSWVPAKFDILDNVDFWKAVVDESGSRTLAIQTPYVQMAITLADLEDLLDEELSLIAWTDADHGKWSDQVVRLEHEKSFLRGASLAQLVARRDLRANPNDPDSPNMEDQLRATLQSDLACELVKSGYIDWNFSLYVGQYYGGRVTLPAINFIIHNVQPNAMNLQIPLNSEDVEAVLRESPGTIFGDRSIYNISIINYLLQNADINEEDARINTILQSLMTWGPDQQVFVSAYVREQGANDLIARLSRVWPKTLSVIYSQATLAPEKKLELFDSALKHAVASTEYDVDDAIRNYLADNYSSLTAFTQTQDELAASETCDLLERLAVRLPSLDHLSKSMREEVVTRSLYMLTAHNLASAVDQAPTESLALDHLQSVNTYVYNYAVTNGTRYVESLTQLDSADNSDLRHHTVDDPNQFCGIIVDIEHHNGAALRRIVDRAAPECQVNNITDVPQHTWPTLSAARRITPTFTNVETYIKQLGIDEPLAELLDKVGNISDGDEADDERRQDVAVQLINASDVLQSPETRVDLAVSIGPPPLDITQIPTEPGQLYGLLLEARLIADNAASWAGIASNADWTTLEFAISRSQYIVEHPSPTLIPAEVLAVLFESTTVPQKLKEAILPLLTDYSPAPNLQSWGAAGQYAQMTGTAVAPSLLVAMAAAGVAAAIVVPLSANQLPKMTDDDFLALCQALGGDYAGIVNPATTKIQLPDDSAHRLFIDRVKKLPQGWSSRSDRKGHINLTRVR